MEKYIFAKYHQICQSVAILVGLVAFICCDPYTKESKPMLESFLKAGLSIKGCSHLPM